MIGRFTFLMFLGWLIVTPVAIQAQAQTESQSQSVDERVARIVQGAVINPANPGADDPRLHVGLAAYKSYDFDRAMEIWRALAEEGNAEAQYRLGLAHEYGIGVEQSGEDAAAWYIRAIEQDHPYAIHNLAVLYDFGRLLPKDYLRARILYTKSANLGVLRSQHNLGIMVFGGRGGPKDEVEGLMWVFISERRGNDSARAIEYMSNRMSVDDILAAEEKGNEWLRAHPQ